MVRNGSLTSLYPLLVTEPSVKNFALEKKGCRMLELFFYLTLQSCCFAFLKALFKWK